jgi:stage II sporulation protein E
MDVHTKDVGRRAGAKSNRLLSYLKRRNAAHPGLVLLGDAAAVGLMYLFSGTHLLFGAYPLGIALLAALRGQSTVFALRGGWLAAYGMGDPGMVYGALFLLTVALRAVFSIPGKDRRLLPDSPGFFREAPQLRASVACVVGFFAAVYQLLVGGLTTVTLLFSVTMIIGVTAATLLFAGVFEGGITVDELLGRTSPVERSRPLGFWIELSALSLLFFGVLALRPYVMLGLSVAYLAAAAATLFISRRYGALRGCVAGLLMTLGASPAYAPAFALLGLFSGVLWEIGLFYALALGVAAGAVWGAYIGQLSGFLAVTPEMTVVASLIWPALTRLGTDAGEEAEGSDRAIRRVTEAKLAETDRRILRLSDAFSSLSRIFHTMSDTTCRPDRAEYLSACDEACRRHCSACAHYADCWEKGEKNALEAMEILSERLYTGQGADAAALPDGFFRECRSVDAILSDIRDAGAKLMRSAATGRNTDALALDYELVARLLSEAVKADRVENREDVKLGIELRRALRARGIVTGSVAVYGQRLKWIVAGGAGWEGASASADEIHREFEEIAGCRLTPPAFEVSEGAVTMQMKTARRFAADTWRACRAATDSEASGDTVSFFENCEEYFYALLSDGMGSGSRAAVTSGICCMFLEKMLGAGNSKTTALKLLNNLVRTGGEESSATVDLLELDLLSGRATFIKSGAAPSYVKRGSNLFRIRSKTVPLGLMRTLDAEKIRFDAEPGDIIIMLSDGISQSSEDAPWLMELLAGEWEEDMDAMAQRIVTIASKTKDRCDDLSVALVRVREIGAEATPTRGESPETEAEPEEIASEEPVTDAETVA